MPSAAEGSGREPRRAKSSSSRARTGRPRTDTASHQRSATRRTLHRRARPIRPHDPSRFDGRPAVQHDPRPGRVRGGRERDDVSLRAPPRRRVPARPAALPAVRVHPRRRWARWARCVWRASPGSPSPSRSSPSPPAIVLIPLRGQTLEQWAPLTVRFLLGALQRRRTVSRPVAHSSATSSRSPTVASTRSPRAPPEARPGELAELEFLEVTLEPLRPGPPRCGQRPPCPHVHRDRFASPAARSRCSAPRIARRALRSTAPCSPRWRATTQPVRRISWIERTLPADADALGNYLLQAKRARRQPR